MKFNSKYHFKIMRGNCEYYRENRCHYYYDELGRESGTQSCQEKGCPVLSDQKSQEKK